MSFKKSLHEIWHHRAVKNILLPWGIIFIILNLANTQDGGPNAISRYLTMRAMSEEGTFQIDKRIGATDDWSQTPDGHYYSNKAPGPMLLGFPAFFVLDQIPRLWEKGFRDENGHRHTPGYFQKTWLSFLNQIFPLLCLMAVILIWMDTQKIRRTTQLFFVLSVFLGSSVSLFYNNYFGHAFNAILQLGLLFALFRSNYKWVGFFAGAALLSDYSFVMQIPALAIVLVIQAYKEKKYLEPLKKIAIGGLVPGILWVWYHTACYGSPFLVANNFQNPNFQDTLNESVNLFGIFRLPNMPILYELLFGESRGLLFTQPWILLLFFFSVYRIFFSKPLDGQNTDTRHLAAIFCSLSLLGLLFMNMSYGGWHGGGSAGPRYISGIFLCFALWAAVEIDAWPTPIRRILWITLGISIIFRGLVYGSTILGPNLPLWQWYFSEFLKTSKTPHLRAGIYTVLLLAGFYWQRKNWRREPSPALQ